MVNNNGQDNKCIKRVIVSEKIKAKFLEKFLKRIEGLKIGDPLDEDTDLGPLIRESNLEKVMRQVKDSLAVSKKNQLLAGGEVMDNYFVKPTIIDLRDK
jgi:succinate-semialdehyde dehydrogenase/glutarate-semialdehyde dehydrogenase